MEFFNDLGKKFSHAARSVQERTREGVENTRLSADLRAARAELERQLTELGRAYFEFAGGGEPVPDELVARVRATMEQIEALSAQRERARQQTRCPGCGAVQSGEARFCSNCGRPMPEKSPELRDAPAADDEVQYCEHCGAMRQNGVRFCTVCGAPFEPGEDAPAPQPPAVPAPAAPLEEPEETDAD